MQCKDWSLREGDSLELMNKLAPDSVDGVITDPPYCSGGRTSAERQAPPSKKYQTTGSKAYPEFLGDHRDQRGFLAWCSLWLTAAWRATREGGVLVTFIDWRMLPTMTDAVQAGGWIWRGIVPWHKPACRPQLGRFRNACEFAIWASKGPLPLDRKVPVLPGLVTAPPVPRAGRKHVAQKPLSVMRELVRIVVPGGLVLDPFAGAGNTGLAALAEGRRFMGIEMHPAYAAIARRRLAAAVRFRDRDVDEGQDDDDSAAGDSSAVT